MSQAAQCNGSLGSSFDRLLYMILPSHVLVEDDSKYLAMDDTLNNLSIHDDVALAEFSFASCQMYKLGLLGRESSTRPSYPFFDVWGVLFLNFLDVLLRRTADSLAEVVVDVR
jgi:hypothetical protein